MFSVKGAGGIIIGEERLIPSGLFQRWEPSVPYGPLPSAILGGSVEGVDSMICDVYRDSRMSRGP